MKRIEVVVLRPRENAAFASALGRWLRYRPKASHLRRFSAAGGLAIAVLSFCSFAGAESAQMPLAENSASELIRVGFELDPQPLTTELAWRADPGEPNPAFARWILERIINVEGLRVRDLRTQGWGVRWDFLESKSHGYVRPDGPSYFLEDRFSCSRTADEWFSTREGTLRALASAQDLWVAAFKERRFALFAALSRVRGNSPASALKTAGQVIRVWKDALDGAWRLPAQKRARAAEWLWYLSQASFQPHCARKTRSKVPPPTLRMLLSTPSPPQPVLQPTSGAPSGDHMPARLWDGIFSIRAAITLGGASANGRLLIDSLAPRSILSPTFLSRQGFLPPLYEVPGAPLERVLWSGEGAGGLARLGSAASIEASGVKLPINDFLIHEAIFFDEPENASPCCDGILGMDFLRKFTIEFSPTKPAGLIIHDSREFTLPAETWFWLPVKLTESYEPETSCELLGRLTRVVWDFGSEEGMRGHSIETARLSCDGNLLLKGRDAPLHGAPIPKKLTIGMKVLGRTKSVLDLPNGRIWFPRAVAEAEIKTNRSGLVLAFEYREGERSLVVRSIAQRSAAEALAKAGLRPGIVISKINEKDASEMDFWEVSGFLSGREGRVVSIAWKANVSKKDLKVAPLSLLE